ncbi:uncharacterized protein LOC105186860 [Harpegnathos saltator]|uniref:uncharacterized protein LOC105186860 n=1 Tax=Harpegnathos saltator TaxID=610380 RepID=UPI00058F48A8|nr:uncharacterized protein LOC105186860 [Harpegnathos saltator]
MKRIAFLVFVFAASAIAEDAKELKEMAENFESDVQTVQLCLDEAETTESEMKAIKEKIDKLDTLDDNIDDETKKSLEKTNRFIACMLEKKEMMVDSKLNVDKILEAIEKDSKYHVKQDEVKECLNTLNNDKELDREMRAMGMMICLIKNEKDEDEKK